VLENRAETAWLQPPPLLRALLHVRRYGRICGERERARSCLVAVARTGARPDRVPAVRNAELTISPPRPLAVSVSVAVPVLGGELGEELDGVTSSAADFVTPPPETEIVTGVSAETDDVKMLKPPRVVPAGTIMPFGTDAAAGLLLVT